MSNITPVQAIKKDLASMKDQFQAALPNHISPEKFIRTAQTAVAMTPNLANATRHSFFAACMQSASEGLLPDNKEAAIVTYKNKQGEHIAQFQPMVAGILKKVRNSGELASITSQIVYKKDEFEFFVDEDGEHLNHRPNMFEDRGKAIGVYAIAKTKDGGVYIEVLTLEQIQAIKKSSRGHKGPWSGPFEMEMWRKSAIKRLSKRLPMSTDLEVSDYSQPADEVNTAQETAPEEPKDITHMAEETPVNKTIPTNLENLVEEQEVVERPAVLEMDDEEVPV